MLDVMNILRKYVYYIYTSGSDLPKLNELDNDLNWYLRGYTVPCLYHHMPSLWWNE